MSDANLNVGIDAGGAVAGSRTVVRSLNDIYSSANALDTKLRGLESTLGRVGANPGLTQAKAAMQQMQSPLQSIKSELEKIEFRIVRIGATALALGAVHVVFGKIREAILGAVKAVDDFQIAVISIAASLTQIRIQNGETDIAGAYEKSSRYAGVLALKLQEVDKNSFANYKGLMAMLQVMTAQGQVLDVNNKKQVAAFTNLSNAIAIMTPGQDQQMQMYQETRALMSGIADRHSQVARMIDQQIKAQDIYKGGLKEVAALGRQHGDTMERLAPYLQGVGAASKDISKTWSTVVATFETALNFIQRAAFGPIVADLTTIVALFSKLMTANTGAISDAMQRSWGFIKDAVFDIDEKTKELKFSPEFLNTLKTASQLALAIIDSFAILVKWTIKYSEELKILIATYIAYKAVLIATATVDKALAASNDTVTAAIINRKIALARLGITESSALTIQQQSLVAARETLLVSAQEVTANATKQAARDAEIASINAAAQAKIKETAQTIENIQVRRWEIGLEQDAQAAKISGLRLNAEILVQERLLAESRAASASAYAKASIAENGRAWSTEAIAIEKTERDLLSAAIGRETAARMSLESVMIRLSGLEAEEISLQSGQIATEQALVNAKVRAIEVDAAATTAATRHNAALLALGETTGFVTAANLTKIQTDYVRLVEQDRLTGSTLAATAVENAHTEALAMNTAAKNANSIANQVLTASTNLLQGALALVGGPIGALIIAIGALTYAWVKLSEAEEENRSKKIKAIFESDLSVAQRELDDVNKKLVEAEKARAKKTDPVKASADEEQDRLNKMMITETKLRKELADAEQNLRTIRLGGASVARDEAEERVRSAKIQVDYFRKVSDETAKAKAKLEEYHKEDMVGYKGSGKPLNDDKAKKSDAEKAFESLIALQDAYQESALRSGKATDELGAKLATLDQQLANDLEQRKEAFKFDPKAAQQAKEYLTVQIEIMKQNAIIADTKKGQETYDKAAEVASLQEYKSNLDYRKSELQRNLEDRQISQQQYFKFMGDLIIEESAREIAEQQKVVDAKKAALSEAASKGIFSGDFKKAQGELITAESALDKVRKDSSKRYEDNLRAQIKLLEEQRKATLALESKNAVDEARAASDSYSNIAMNPFKQIELELAAEKAAIKAKYDMERDEIQSKMNALKDGTDQQLAVMDLLHQQQMSYIDAENKLRIEGLPNDQRLAEQKRYADAKLEIETDAAKKSSEIQSKISQQSAKLQSALSKAMELTHVKQKNEEVKVTQNAENKKWQTVSAYAELGAEAFRMLASTQDQSSREGFESAKALNLAAAVMSTAASIMAQLAGPDGWTPLAWARAGIAAATGAIQIATIASTTFGGGAQAPSAPSGSFASAGIASGGASGFGNLTTPLMSVYDSQTDESLQRLTESTDNAAVAIGRLSTGIDRLTSLFSEGGAGMGLASNMPGRFADLSGSKQINPFGTTALMNSLKDAAFINGIDNAVLTLFTGGLSSVFGSLFASENRLMGSGIQLAVKDGVVQALNYEDREQGSWWSGSKRVIYTSPNEEASEFMEALVTPMRNEIDRMALALGTVANASAVNISATSVLGSGVTPEEAAKALEEWTYKYLQSIAMTVEGLSDFVGAYDDAYAKLIEYNNAVVSTNNAFELIGKAQLQGSLKTGEFLAAVQRDLFGGMEGFNEAIDTYFGSLFTDAEQEAALAAQAQRDLDRAFAEMGQTIPSTRQEFRDLVNSLDITTVSGAQLFAGLMDVSEAFDLVMTAADEAAEHIKTVSSAMQDLDVRLLTAQGNSSESDAMARQLSGQREIEQAITDNMGTAYIARLYQVLATEKQAAENKLSYEAMNTTITNQYNTELAALNSQLTVTQSIVSTLTGYVNKLVSARQKMRLNDESYQRNQYIAAQATLAAVLTQARSGDLSGIANMDDSLAVLTAQGTDAYANSSDYQRDFWNTSNSIAELEKLTGYQLTDAEKAVSLAKTQIDVLNANHTEELNSLQTINSSIIVMTDTMMVGFNTLAQWSASTGKTAGVMPGSSSSGVNPDGNPSVNNSDILAYVNNAASTILDTNAAIMDVYQASVGAGVSSSQLSAALIGSWNWTVDGINSWVDSMGLPRFASGGITTGISIAGEAGPEAIIPLPDGRRVPVQMTGSADNAELIAEVRALRGEVVQLRSATAQISKASQKQLQYTEDWDANGLPEVRTA